MTSARLSYTYTYLMGRFLAFEDGRTCTACICQSVLLFVKLPGYLTLIVILVCFMLLLFSFFFLFTMLLFLVKCFFTILATRCVSLAWSL